MRTTLVTDALKATLADRGSLRGAIIHADHGAQYTSKDYAKLCDHLGVTLSLGSVGTSADNALAESFNATLKRETLAGSATFTDEQSCRREIFRWAVRYNTRRRHSYCNYLSPNAYENQLAATIPEAALSPTPRVQRSGARSIVCAAWRNQMSSRRSSHWAGVSSICTLGSRHRAHRVCCDQPVDVRTARF